MGTFRIFILKSIWARSHIAQKDTTETFVKIFDSRMLCFVVSFNELLIIFCVTK